VDGFRDSSINTKDQPPDRFSNEFTALAATITEILKERGASTAAAGLATEAGLAIAKVASRNRRKVPRTGTSRFI
jgi:hypothetical protein